MFFGGILLFWAALHVYLFWRAASVPFIKRHVPWGVLAALALFLWAVFPLSHSLEDSSVGSLARILVYVGATWVGVLFLLVVAMLAADLVTAFGLIFRKAAPALRGWALVAGGALAAFALVQGSRAPVMRNYDVQIANWPPERNGAVVVVASDLHLGSLLGADWLAARVDQINAQRPDLIVLAGDIVEGHGESSRQFLPQLRKLSAPWGVWAVNGNHDSYGRADDASDQHAGLLEGAGVHVLRDQWAQVQPGIILAGVDDLTSRGRHGQPLAGVIDRALAGRPAGATIFVSHTPWLAESVANHGAALMLSAHTHGGQIWPFNYYVQLSYPLMGGRYEIKGMPVIVCRGTGTWGPRMRLWHPSEILRVTLLSPPTSAHRL